MSEKSYEDISGTFWWTFVNSANKRKLIIDIDKKYIWNLYIKQNKKCALSGENLVIDKFKNTKQLLEDDVYFASLDRIDNNKGYIDGNVRWVAREINYMKWKYSDDLFLMLCKNISLNNDKY